MPRTLTEREPRAARRGRPPIKELEEEAADETDVCPTVARSVPG